MKVIFCAIALLIMTVTVSAATRTAIMKQEEAQTERSVQLRASDPGSPATNQLYINTTEQLLKYYNGTSTISIGGGGGGGGGVNLLGTIDNPGFESCSGASCPSWTASGGTVGTESSTPLYETKSATFDASALNQTFSSSLIAIPEGLKGKPCVAAFSYKYSGSSGDYKAQIFDGTSVVTGADKSLDTSASSKDDAFQFTCPSSGSIRFRVIANVSNPGIITLDGFANASGKLHFGSDLLQYQTEGNGFIGFLHYANAATCTWNSPSSTGWQSLQADTNCNTATVSGLVTAPASKIPATGSMNLKAGKYKVTMRGPFQDISATQVSWGVYDGTNRSGEVYGNNSTGAFMNSVVGFFDYATDQTGLVFEPQCNNPTAATNCRVVNQTATGVDPEFSILIERIGDSPVLTNIKNVRTYDTSAKTNATGYISNSGSPTVTRGSYWLGSPTDNGVGDTTVNISSGVFSSTPDCQCTGYEETADTDGVHCSVDKTTSPSSTVLRIRTRLGATLTDRDFSLICTGPQ